MSEEQAFRSQHGRPSRNDDVADCIAIASSTPPCLAVPHRSYLRSPDITAGSIPNVDSQQPEFAMRHSFCGSASPSSMSSAVTSGIPVTGSEFSTFPAQHNWPTSTSRRSLTESKWKWLHSNAVMPEQPSPVSLRRSTRLDIPSSTAPSLYQDFWQQLAGSQNVSDTQSQAHTPRLYYSTPVVDHSGPTEQLQRRKTPLDVIQSVSGVHRSFNNDQSVRHWRHSSDNTARHSTAEPTSHKWDSYGLTLSLSGAAVPPSRQSLGNDFKKHDLDQNNSANGHASGDLPQKLPLERIMRFEEGARLPKDVITVPPSRSIASCTAALTGLASIDKASSPPVTQSSRAGRLSIPDSIPIYFRAEPSAASGSSRLQTKSDRSDCKTVPYTTEGRQQPASVTNSQSTSTYVLSIPFVFQCADLFQFNSNSDQNWQEYTSSKAI